MATFCRHFVAGPTVVDFAVGLLVYHFIADVFQLRVSTVLKGRHTVATGANRWMREQTRSKSSGGAT